MLVGGRVVGMFWVSCMGKQGSGKSSTVSNGHRAFGKGVCFGGVHVAEMLRGVPSSVAGKTSCVDRLCCPMG